MVKYLLLKFIRNKWVWGGVLLLSISLISYYKGYQSAKKKFELLSRKDAIERYSDYVETRDHLEDQLNNYKHNIRTNSTNDKRDSCILSNDPYAVDCLQ